MKKKLFKLTSKFAALALAGFAALNAQAEATLTGTQVNEGVPLTGELNLDGINNFAGITNSTGLVTQEIPYDGYYVPDEYLEEVAEALDLAPSLIATGRAINEETGQPDTFKHSVVVSEAHSLDRYSKGMVEVATVEGTTKKMFSIRATSFSDTFRYAIAGSIDVDINFQSQDKFDNFLKMYNDHGVVFLFDGIGYIHSSTNISLDVKLVNGDGDILDSWGGGAFVAGTQIDGSNALYLPEPSTATMSLLALAGLLARRRRKAA